MNFTKNWYDELGPQFVEDIGMQNGDRILDFGCGEGHFSIPAAQKVNKDGAVFALDKNQTSINELRNKINQLSINNITTVQTEGELSTTFAPSYFDYILVYDILHYFNKKQRSRLFKDLYTKLKHRGIISVYPKHTINNFPLDHLKKTTTEEIISEIKSYDLSLKEEINTEILHSGRVEQGIVYNFVKVS